jgi:hypothetical protein
MTSSISLTTPQSTLTRPPRIVRVHGASYPLQPSSRPLPRNGTSRTMRGVRSADGLAVGDSLMPFAASAE